MYPHLVVDGWALERREGAQGGKVGYRGFAPLATIQGRRSVRGFARVLPCWYQAVAGDSRVSILPSQRAAPTDPDQPCVRNCCLDDRDVCLGCGRTLDDIRAWGQMSGEARRTALEAAAERVAVFRARWGQGPSGTG
jgi:predicted Fe-S protein YdhL (DUF1289 family)